MQDLVARRPGIAGAPLLRGALRLVRRDVDSSPESWVPRQYTSDIHRDDRMAHRGWETIRLSSRVLTSVGWSEFTDRLRLSLIHI